MVHVVKLLDSAVADPGGDPREQRNSPFVELIFSNLQSFTVIFNLMY